MCVNRSAPAGTRLLGCVPESCSLSTHLLLTETVPWDQVRTTSASINASATPAVDIQTRQLSHSSLSHHDASCSYTLQNVHSWNSAWSKSRYLIYKRQSCYFFPVNVHPSHFWWCVIARSYVQDGVPNWWLTQWYLSYACPLLMFSPPVLLAIKTWWM